MKVWQPLQQTRESHCLETVTSGLLGLQEPLVLPGKHDCRWLDLQHLLRREHNCQLHRIDMDVAAEADKPRVGDRAWLAFVDDPDDGRRHSVVAQRDWDGVLRVTHDPARDTPADRYRVTCLVSFDPAEGTLASLGKHGRCEDHCGECWWFGY